MVANCAARMLKMLFCLGHAPRTLIEYVPSTLAPPKKNWPSFRHWYHNADVTQLRKLFFHVCLLLAHCGLYLDHPLIIL